MRYGICNKPIAPLYEKANYCQAIYGHGSLGGDSGHADEILYGWIVSINDDYMVKTEYGYRGYVDLNDFIMLKSLDEIELYGDAYYVDRCSMDVLCEPRVTARVLMTLYRGSYVRIKNPLTVSEGWVTLLLNNGEEGFVQACMVKKRILLPQISAPKKTPQSIITDNRLREEIANSARKYLGAGYRWGGKTPLGIDCSGLTFMSYFENGIFIYRDAKLKDDYPVRKIPLQMIGVGDLLYFPGHIALYIGKNQYIHSTAKEGSFGVVINSLDPRMPNYRADLHERLEAVGSIFAATGE